MPINLFVDANILLGFYGLSSVEIEELRKLSALIGSGQLVLWFPLNVWDEYVRNRPKVLAEALRALRDSRLKVSFPLIADGMPEREKLEQVAKEAQRLHSELLKILETRAATYSFEADALIAQLFSQARRISTETLLGKAKDRRDLRRPPGKSDSLGDAVHWEALLADIPVGQEIHLVSGDGDFRSPLQQTPALHEYLAAEWHTAKQAGAYLYADLAIFSRKHFPELKLATDVLKAQAISELAASQNFSTTHAVIVKLSAYDLFTPEQARLIVSAALANSQVYWIAGDPDVSQFFHRIIQAHHSTLDAEELKKLYAHMSYQRPPGDVAGGLTPA